MATDRTYPDGTILRSSAIDLPALQTIFQKLTLGMLGKAVSVDSPLVRIQWPQQGAPFQDANDDVCYLRFTLEDDPYTKIRDRFSWFPSGYGEGGFGGSPAIGYGIGDWGGAPWGGDPGTPPIPWSAGGYGSQPYGGTPGKPNGWGDGGFGDGGWGGDSGDPVLLEQWSYTRAWKVRFCCYGPQSVDNQRAIRSGLYQDYFTNILQNSRLFPVSEFSDPVRVPELINGQWFDRVDADVVVYEFVTETLLRNTIKSVEVLIAESAAGPFADLKVSIP